jgi:hypothetical protein
MIDVRREAMKVEEPAAVAFFATFAAFLDVVPAIVFTPGLR